MERITVSQLKAARTALGWLQKDLAERSGVSIETIRRIERSDTLGTTRLGTLTALVSALQAGGVELFSEDDSVGLLWREAEGR
jgi:transcriptional regulator with XRE-family HTH domain